ncbi:uncharacterized protein [Medicago truncatula]|uniref:uncharacterized protein isoform X2 n=1 Tax=Medicago truncatula TaxID=3880 RepID=UPI0019672B3F|nr:uncharacterized protein LOC25484746 isoform X2 [Medicago truncatula]
MGRAIQREKEKEVEFDIESGENTSEEDTSNDERDSNSKNGFPWSWNGVMNLDGSEKGLEHVNGNHGKQKIKFTNPRKPQKPPLPPRGPSLDAGDHKFVKELAELALRKRARIKKMNAVKKMKASKLPSSSTYTNLSAMVITIFFFLVIIFHGIKSASSASVGLTASPESAVASDEGLISVQYPTNFNTSNGDEPGSRFPSMQEG